MRKPLVVLVAILPLFSSMAQTILEKETHRFRAGDYLMKQQVEFIDLSTSGEDISWDLTAIKEIDERRKVSYTEYADSLLLARELRTLYRYQFREDTLFSTGQENPTTLIQYYRQPELYLIYPVSYGDRQEAFYYGVGNYCKQLDLILKGKSAYHADAWGTLFLPEGDSIRNVLRTHHTKWQVEEQYPHYSFSIIDSICTDQEIAQSLATDTVLTQTDSYRWYAPGYRYPVFETIRCQFFHHGKVAAQTTTAFYYPPDEQYYDLDHDVENLALREQIEMEKAEEREKQNSRRQNNNAVTGLEKQYAMEGFSYQIVMDKEAAEVAIDYQLYKEAEVEVVLTDLQGRILERMPKSFHQSGSYTYTFPLLDYPKGEYLIRINTAGKGFTEKIIK